jgi:hypothetical protein
MAKAAPEPRDLFWPNLSSRTANIYLKVFRSILVYIAMFFMVFFTSIAVSAIASLIDLKSLAEIIPGLKNIIESISPVSLQFIQGVIPVAVLVIWTSTLPTFLFCNFYNAI